MPVSGMSKDFSGVRKVPWRLWLVVLVLHLLALSGLNAALTLNRLAAQAEQSLDVAILPSEPQKIKSAPAPAPDPVKAEPESQPAETALALPVAMAESVQMPAQAALDTAPEKLAASDLRATPPARVLLRYVVTKGGDSAQASLRWQPLNATPGSADVPYELTYEATYFGVPIIKQISMGVLGSAGLLPTRFGEKRRGKSEQATHFDHVKNAVTFSNNRPESKLAKGSQDRASFLIQLASLFAGQPDQLKTGQVMTLPVASVDELELWAFEVQASESLALPISQMQAIKVLRRPRRAFDQTVEVWLAPALAYLPVRIRLTDSGGVTDSQLSSKE